MVAVTFKENMEWSGSPRAEGEAVNMDENEARQLAREGKVNIFQPMTEISESHPVDPSRLTGDQDHALDEARKKVNAERNAVQTTPEPQAPGVDSTQEQMTDETRSIDNAPVNKQVKNAPEKK